MGFSTEATTQYQDWAAEDEIGMTVRTTALPSSSRPAGVGVEVHEWANIDAQWRKQLIDGVSKAERKGEYEARWLLKVDDVKNDGMRSCCSVAGASRATLTTGEASAPKRTVR